MKRHYIKCSQCGDLVEVKSEYMVFCPSCRRKLENSYVAWRGRHPEGDFAAYLSEVSVSETALEGLSEQRRIGRAIGRGRVLRRVAVAVGIAVAATVLGMAGYWAWSRYGASSSIRGLLDRAWQIAYYEDLGATLKFPFPLEPEGAFSADSLQRENDRLAGDSLQRQVVVGAVSRRWVEPETVSVTACRIDYQPDFGVDRDIATRQILLSMLQENGLQGFEFYRNDYSVPNLRARSLSGSYLLGVEAFEFRALMAQEGHTVWYFMVAYRRSEPEGLLVAERFFRGILLDRRLRSADIREATTDK